MSRPCQCCEDVWLADPTLGICRNINYKEIKLSSTKKVEVDGAKFSHDSNIKRMQSEEHHGLSESSEIVFLGSGTSGGLPTISHLLCSDELFQTLEVSTQKAIQISRNAAIGDPRHNKNYRCNPSILIKYRPKRSHDTAVVYDSNILIDVGKTFREAAIRWLPQTRIHHIDAVILTHGHADAIFGLDDLRSLTLKNQPIKVYQSESCEEVTRRVFSYLYKDNDTNDSKPSRFVSNIDWNRINYFEPFTLPCGLEIFPFPVQHGHDTISLGFLFGGVDRVCYISDISDIGQQAIDLLMSHSPLDIMIIDSLTVDQMNPFHYCLNQAIQLATRVGTKKLYAIGMNASMEYEAINETLKSKKLTGEISFHAELSHDGLTLNVNL